MSAFIGLRTVSTCFELSKNGAILLRNTHVFFSLSRPSLLPLTGRHFPNPPHSERQRARINFKPLHVRKYSSFDESKSLVKSYVFVDVEEKNKKTFHEVLASYSENFPTRKGVANFILLALKYMEEFGVLNDLETYKKLVDLMPKGKYVPTSTFQVALFFHLHEQDCIVELLCQMEENGVIPDVEMGELLRKIFGRFGEPNKKFNRMMYWMPKFKDMSPWLLPRPLPSDSFSLAKIAIERITSVDLQTEITAFRTEEVEDSIDKTWIVSAQSPTQRELLREHNIKKPIIVEGGESVWVHKNRINYFILKSGPIPPIDEPPKKTDFDNMEILYMNSNYQEKKERTVHEQEDGIIYAVCATGTSKKDSLLSWIRLLEKHGNPALENLAVLFRFKKLPEEPVVVPEYQSSQA